MNSDVTFEANSPHDGGPASTKKNNKLGYTRTSIACSHCRRRKIRCMISNGDPEKRCVNCIKLKRPCIFTSVDTTSSTDARSQSMSQSSRTRSRSPPGRSDEREVVGSHARNADNVSSLVHRSSYSDDSHVPLTHSLPDIQHHDYMVPIRGASSAGWGGHPDPTTQPEYHPGSVSMPWQSAGHVKEDDDARMFSMNDPSAPPYQFNPHRAVESSWNNTIIEHRPSHDSQITGSDTAYPHQFSHTAFHEVTYDQVPSPMDGPGVIHPQYYSQHQHHTAMAGPHATQGQTGQSWDAYHHGTQMPDPFRHDSAHWLQGRSYTAQSTTSGADHSRFPHDHLEQEAQYSP